jgi:hypothetical protein
MSVLIWFNSLLVLENDTCKDGSECVIVIIVFRYVIYIVTKFIKKKKEKKLIAFILLFGVFALQF